MFKSLVFIIFSFKSYFRFGNGDSRRRLSAHFVFLLLKQKNYSAGSSKMLLCLWWLVNVSVSNGLLVLRNFDLKDKPSPGRSTVEKVDEIRLKVEVDRYISTFYIGTELNVNHISVLNLLQRLDTKRSWMLGSTWINVASLNGPSFSICQFLLKR